jgi:iron complex transport system ATP-binding protein
MILDAHGLSFHYHNSRTIFKDVNFCVDKGEVFSILGINGAGKSTLLNCLSNLITPQEGKIFFDGKPVKEMSIQQVAKNIGYVPQQHNAVYSYTVLEFTVMGRTPHIGTFATPSENDYAIASGALERMGVSHLAEKAYTEISGGERQLVLIARVLTQQPKIIMLDEPTSHLDYGNQFRTVNLIREIASEGYGVIMTTHMPDHAIILNDKVGILDANGALTVGNAEEILTSERLSELYNLDIKTEYVDSARRTVCIACNTAIKNSEKKEC